MCKINKQDIIFIGRILLFIVATFTVYFVVRWYFVDTCVLPHEKGYIGYALNVRHTKICFGSGGFFDKYSLYFYVLFLWVTIIPFIQKKYLFPSNKVFIAGIGVVLLVILYVYRTTV